MRIGPVLVASLGVALPLAAQNEKANQRTFGNFVLLDKIIEDGADRLVAKRNAELTLRQHPDLDAMVGLWAYNGAMCLQALEGANKINRIKLFAFDEDPAVLQAIKAGTCEGTLVQDPYQMGFRSITHLKALLSSKGALPPGQRTVIPLPTRIVTRDTVDSFLSRQASYQKRLEDARANPPQEAGPTFAFVTNVADPWWGEAEAGCLAAAEKLGAQVRFIMNHSATVAAQNEILEELMKRDEIEGLAISALNPGLQTEMINKIAATIPVITVDSDVPDSKRLLHLGTDPYQNGKRMGEFMKKSMPEGGRIMLFVGMIDQLNASRRRDGLLDALKTR